MIEILRARGLLSPLDEHFARTLCRLAGETDARVALASALVSRQVREGHVCLDLRRWIGRPLIDDAGVVFEGEWPEIDAWLAAIAASPLVAGAGSAAESERPLVLDEAGRLYLQRYWSYQQRLAAAILARTAEVDADTRRAGDGPPHGDEPDWQLIATLAATECHFCVVSGGPGTGKTYTVTRILARLIERELAAGRRPPRVLLVAPTGKAAARLKETIRHNKAALDVGAEVREAIPEDAATIHRTLGARLGSSTRFRHHAGNPLLADVVLVDEASMVDLSLMARLVEAVPPAARLILLGDMDQLASVEAGAVLGDICNTGGIRRHSRAFAAHVASSLGQTIPVDDSAPAERGLWDCIVHLQQSHRYAPDSDIGALVRAINRGDADRALQILAQPDSAVSLIEGASPQAAAAAVAAVAADGFSPFLAAATPLARLARLEEFRILCVHRRGPLGVETLNREVERLLEQRGQLQTGSGRHYPGRPLIVTENDYQLELFNGDVGVIAEATDGRPMAFFAASGGVRSVPPSRLPAHETVFAMTVHKAQGSELATVAVALPSEISPLLSRELLYTAVSRAQSRVLIYGRREILRHAIETRIERASGLRERLWETGC